MFLIAGLGVAYFTFVTMTQRYFETQNWQNVQATIDELSLEKNYGEDSTTYRVVANYRYQFNGLSYSNQQVALNDTQDNIGDYWQRLYQQLQKNRSLDKVFAWVDPNNPSDALLDRTFRWEKVAFGSLFILMFGGFGAGTIWLSLKSTPDKLATAMNGIASQEKDGHTFIFYFGLFFFLIGALIGSFAIPSALRNGEYGAFILLAFMAVGVWVMYIAQRKKKTYHTIGPSPLFLDPLPGAIGGQIGGHFTLGLQYSQQPLDVKITCLSKRKSGKKTRSSILWQEQIRAYCQQSIDGMHSRFTFDVPDHLPASREWQKNSCIEWEIESTGMLMLNSQAIEFQRTWSIPAEHSTAKSQIEQQIPEPYQQEQAEAVLAAASLSADQQIEINSNTGSNHDSLEIISHAGRHLGTTIGTFLIGLVFVASGFFTVMQNWYPGYLFIVIGLICTLLGLFLAGRKITTTINTQSRFLHLRRSWFNIGLYSREVALFSPKQLDLQRSSSTTQGSKFTEHFKLIVNSEVPAPASKPTANEATFSQQKTHSGTRDTMQNTIRNRAYDNIQNNARNNTRNNTQQRSGTYDTLSMNKQYTFAEGINGRKAAQALLDKIIEQVF